MLSCFPGMNPFVEEQEWADFHPSFNVTLAEFLVRQFVPSYVARIQRREYTDLPSGEEHRETYLVLRHVESQQVVTVIETLHLPTSGAGRTGIASTSTSATKS